MRVIPVRPTPLVPVQSTTFGQNRLGRYQQRLQDIKKQQVKLFATSSVQAKTDPQLGAMIEQQQNVLTSEYHRLQEKINQPTKIPPFSPDEPRFRASPEP